MLYNIKKSFATHQIIRGNHKIYFEEYGNKQGLPVLFLHGGPGSGCNDSHKSIFDHKKFRVIFIDQRGSGKSKPKGLTSNNTTQLLIKDIEFIRNYLNIDSWLVVGGSWGATLAVAYAELHNSKIEGLILRALFLGTKKEVDWAFYKAPSIFRPQLIFELNKILKQKITINPIYTLGKMLESKSIKLKSTAAKLWGAYESNLSTIKYKYDFLNNLLADNINIQKEVALPNTPFMEWHYIKNNFFLSDNQLLKNRKKIESIPIAIIQSDYDLLCPPATSYTFSKGLKNCKIYRVECAGHYISDPGVKEKMKQLLDSYEKN